MTVRVSEESDFLELKNLWFLGFNDPMDFVDYFFDTLYQEQNTTVALDEKNQLCASAQSVFFKMKFFNDYVNSNYVLGVVTHPEQRKRGYSSEIMKFIAKKQFREGILISSLIPQFPYLFDIYRKFGYEEFFYIKEENVNRNSIKVLDDVQNVFCYSDLSEIENLKQIYDFYISFYEKADFSIIKSFEDFSKYLDEFLKFEGKLLISKENDEINALACFVDTFNPCYIVEFLYLTDDYKSEILSYIFKTITQENIKFKTIDIDKENKKPLGMIRIVNVLKILELFASHTKEYFDINLFDDIITENSGFYKVCDDFKIVKEPLKQGEFITINELNKLIFNEDCCSYMNSLLNS